MCFSLIHDTYDIGKRIKFKESQTLLHNLGVVYKRNCSCGQSYIGETRRKLITRINDTNHMENLIKFQTVQITSH